MALTVSVVKAAENALFAWLSSELPDVAWSNEWPEAGKAFVKSGSCSLLRAGSANETPIRPIQLLKAILDPYQITGSYVWRTHSVEQPLQLDVWATSELRRDDILHRLGDALTAGPGLTLTPAYFAAMGISQLQNPVAQTVLLQLAKPWDHLNASFQFDAPETHDDPEDIKARRYRATYRGTGYFDRTVTRASPKIVRVSIPIKVSRAAVPDASTPVLATLTVAATPTAADPAATTTTVTRGS